MANFEEAFRLTDQTEGGYVNDPDDMGKETYRGVSRASFPKWNGWQIIDKYKEECGLCIDSHFDKLLANDQELDKSVKQLYKEIFWDKLMLDNCNNQIIANELYDTAVNQSYATAAKYLQTSLNLLNRDQTDYPDLKVDGVIGIKTMGTLNEAIAKGERWISGILKCLNGEQYMRYRALALFSSKQEKFMHGWLKRVSF